MALTFGDVGGLDIYVVYAKNSGLQLFTRPEIDILWLHGNDIQVCPFSYLIP